MKVKVKQVFQDKYTSKYHKPGAVIEISDERGEDLISRGIAEEVKSKKKKDDNQ